MYAKLCGRKLTPNLGKLEVSMKGGVTGPIVAADVIGVVTWTGRNLVRYISKLS